MSRWQSAVASESHATCTSHRARSGSISTSIDDWRLLMRTTHWQRALLLMITACLVACSCMGGDPGSPSEPLTPATATIEDMLAVDGCSIVVTVDRTEYAPDAHTRTTIRSRMLPML